MKLRDCMVYAGIRSSRKFCRLNWFQRDFFMGLLNAADPKGRFEVDAELLRAALYAPVLSKVSIRDVQGAIVACREAGLVKLWTEDDGRGYGEVINYRQTGLKTKKSDLPAPPGSPPEPDLFTDPPPDEFARIGKKEEKSPHSPPPAGGADAYAFSSEPAKPRRVRRLPKLETLRDELAAVEQEMTQILRPGGCAYNIPPTGEKAARFEKLKLERERVKKAIETTREALSNQ